jgi:hypothetical protein
LEEVEAKAEGGRGTGNDASMAKPPQFDGTTSWAVFWHQFEIVVEHNCWTRQEKSTYLIIALQSQATNVLHSIPKGATYEETLKALDDCFGDQHIAAAYCSQLKARTRKARKSLQEVATAIEQLAHHGYPTLPEDHIRREAGKAFMDTVEDPDIKMPLLIGGQKTVTEALREPLELQVVLLAARPQKMSTKSFWGSQSHLTRRWNTRQSGCWSCGEPGHFQGSSPYGKEAENDRHWKREDRPTRDAGIVKKV